MLTDVGRAEKKTADRSEAEDSLEKQEMDTRMEDNQQGNREVNRRLEEAQI